MIRRYLYFGAAIVFVAVSLWYAAGFSGVPQVTFAQAAVMSDSVAKVMVPGRVDPGHGIEIGEGGLTFYMKDNSGGVQRVVYDGAETVDTTTINEALSDGKGVEVAGHVCSDAQGERFHAKNIYID